MCFRFLTHRVRCTLQESSKFTNRVFSRALTTHNYQHTSDPEDDFVSFNHQIFSNNENKSSIVSFDENKLNIVDLELLSQPQQRGSVTTPYILNKIVSSCAKLASLCMGIQVHSAIIKLGFSSNVYICSALVGMYGKCNRISSAQRVFDDMHERNVVTWNSLISGYLNVECPGIAIDLFLDMLEMGIAPTLFSVSAVLVACSQLDAGELGIQVHGLSVKTGFCNNVVVGTGLIDMYSKCWNVDDSRLVFNEMSDRNVITWTSMVTRYAQNQQPDEAMILVRKMQQLGLRSNHVTYNSLLSSFSRHNDLDHCKQVHCRIIQEGLESNVYLIVTLVTVYSECGGSLEDFHKLCLNVTRWDQISWNAVIAGFSSLGNGEEALKRFSKMRQVGINIDSFTFASILRAAGIISALEEGKQTHALVFKAGYTSNVPVQNGLVSMYARCGAINESKRVFLSMEEHDLISWNSFLSGCAHHGHGREAVEVFEQMRKTGIKPDRSTYLSVLSACSHVGLLDKGLEYFDLMKNDYLLEPPRVEHYASIVDLFGRSGYLHEAEAFVDSMPIEPGPSVYKALLSACQVHGNMEIAVRSAKKLVELCPNDPATYVLLSNILATGGYWDDAAGVRRLMCDRGVRKNPGYSWI